MLWQQEVQTVEIPSAMGTGTEIVDIHFNQLNDNPDEEEPSWDSQSTTPRQSSAKRPKFYWKWNIEAEAWFLNNVDNTTFLEVSRQNGHFQEGAHGKHVGR